MSLRILFADDSVTAQNMGKKILTEAGYDVVAVSNGAAAVKKIAEQKPDIIILDVYMPGYTGLEVCEKVRGSMETLKTPVLLTVGKMEPYKAEEVNRVRADGVIVKPFEASDLLAIVKKFEERISQTPAPPLVRQAVAVERFAPAAVEGPVEAPEPIAGTSPQPTVEVPDHMATSSAFSDLLGADSTGTLSQFDINQAPPPPPEPQPYRVPEHARIPEYETPVSWRDRIEDDPRHASTPAPFSANTPDLETSAAVEEPPARAVEESPAQIHPPQIPVYQESRQPGVEIIPTAAASIGDVEIPRDPALQESAAETTRATVADSLEPGLIPTLHQETEPVSPVERQAAELAPVESDYVAAIPEEPQGMAAPEIPAYEAATAVPEPAPTPLHMRTQVEETHHGLEGPESDFETRVAAAMAAYSHVPESPLSLPSSLEPVSHMDHYAPAGEVESPAVTHNASAETPHVEEVIPEVEATHAAPSFEYQPPVGGAAEAEPAAVEPAVVEPPAAAHEAFAPAHETSAPVVEEALADHIEAALPAAAAAAAAGADTGSDHHTIAQAVHRVMERLKPELVEEIVRELKSKK